MITSPGQTAGGGKGEILDRQKIMNWNLARTLRLLSPHLVRSAVGSLTID